MRCPIRLLDYAYEFSRDIMRRLLDCGVESIWVFDKSAEQQLSPGVYDVNRTTVPYVEMAKEVGIKEVYIQVPIWTPKWVPDSWRLYNELGYPSKIHHTLDQNEPGMLCQELTSYWCPDAEEHLHGYVQALRDAIEPYATVIPATGGSAGEYIFPASVIVPQEALYSPWWFDQYAEASYRASGMGRLEWWHRERKAIIERRFSWYKERWSCYVHTMNPRYTWARGHMDIEEQMKTLDPRPNTIIWCGMKDKLLPTTLHHAKDFVTWTGAEGSANAAKNRRRVLENDLPIAGLLCGPAFSSYEGGFTDTVFKQIAEAIAV